jgi:hypothetical protein
MSCITWLKSARFIELLEEEFDPVVRIDAENPSFEINLLDAVDVYSLGYYRQYVLYLGSTSDERITVFFYDALVMRYWDPRTRKLKSFILDFSRYSFTGNFPIRSK